VVLARSVAEGRAWFTELLRLADAGVRPQLVAAGLVRAGQLAYCEGQSAAALDLLHKGKALAEQVSDERALANAEHVLGNVKRMQGDLKGAKEHYTRAYTLAQAAGRLATESWMLVGLAITCLEQGDYSSTRALPPFLNLALERLDELYDWTPDNAAKVA
jgi:tetratricopeptide (TPR) repeat protein